MLQQGGLAAAGTAGEQQARPAPGPRFAECVGEEPQFVFAAPESMTRGSRVTASHVLTVSQEGPIAAGAGGHTGRFTDTRTESHEVAGSGSGGSGARVRAVWESV
ncbi:hypothetical protein GCM10026982_00780 [Nocardiopsis aegyptia]